MLNIKKNETMSNNKTNTEIKNQGKNIDLEQLIKEGKISKKTAEKVKIAKSYIEQKYKNTIYKKHNFDNQWNQIIKCINSAKIKESAKEEIKTYALQKLNNTLRKNRQKVNINQFEIIKTLGKGASGEVKLCRYKLTNEYFAIKKMRKEIMQKKNQIISVKTEKDILYYSNNNQWVSKLCYSFQNNDYLFLVIEFLQGGDLMNLLTNKITLTENEAKFYIAELILAVDSIHKLNIIHRDIKPNNILIAANGHIKLSDFGLSVISDNVLYPFSCPPYQSQIEENTDNLTNTANISNKSIKLNRPNRLMAYSQVGTPDYIAPEIIEKKGYNQDVDWWSVGIILYEMLVGYPPFFCENPRNTLYKIKNFEKYFSFPKELCISICAQSLIKKFICPSESRLKSLNEIKMHPFFKNFDWKNILNMTPPFIPNLSSKFDTKYFNYEEDNEDFEIYEETENKPNNIYLNYDENINRNSTNDNNCFGFTFNRDIADYADSTNELLMLVKDKISEKENDNNMSFSDSNSSVDNLSKSNRSYMPDLSKSNTINSNESANNSGKFSTKSTKITKKCIIIPFKNLIYRKKSNSNINLSNSSHKLFNY